MNLGNPREGIWKSDVRTATLIGLLAFVFYFPACWWGIPHATAADRVNPWGVDDATPLAPLAEVHNVFFPKPDRNLGYPLFHPFLLAAAYSPYLAFLWLTGRLGSPSGTYPFGFADPAGSLATLGFIARFVSVMLGAGTVIAAFLAAQRLWNRRTAVWASLFVMSLFPMFYYSRTGNVDVPVLFFIALALAAYAHILSAGLTGKRAAWLGIFVGCALGTKEPALAAFIGLPFVLLPIHAHAVLAAGKRIFSRDYLKPVGVALGAALLAFGLCSGLFVDPGRFFAHVDFVRQRVHAAASGEVAFVKTYPYTWQGNADLARRTARLLVNAMTMPGLVLGVLGIGWTVLRAAKDSSRQHRLAAAFALPAFTYLLVLFLSARVAQLRYVLPVEWVLAMFAGVAVSAAWDSSRMRAWIAVWATFVLGLSILRGVDLTYSMLKDSRYDAAAWLGAHTRPGTRIEYFGPNQKLPALEAGVVSRRAVGYLGAAARPRSEPEVVREILDGWKSRKPDFILSIPDHSSPPGAIDSATCPPAVSAALLDGSIGYRLAAQFHTAPLLHWVRRPPLDYPSVNPPVRIFSRVELLAEPGAGGGAR